MKAIFIALVAGIALLTGAADKNTESAKADSVKQKKLDKTEKSDELTVTSQNLEYDHANHTAVFTRNVKAINGETTMTAKKMACYFDKNNDPYLIIAEGNVVIKRIDQTAYAQKAVYKMTEETILLKYKPSVLRGKNLIKGRVITFFEKTGICEVEDPDVTLFNDAKLKPKKAPLKESSTEKK